MKNQSIISSLSVAAFLLPALNHASPAINQKEAKTTDSSVPKKKYDPLIGSVDTNSGALCVAPNVQESLDLKAIKIYNIEANTAKNDVANKDSDPPSTTPGEDGTQATESTDTDDDTSTPEYDRHSVFGVESKIFTRLTQPVKNLFSDVMFAYTNLNRHNRAYNLDPLKPESKIGVQTINAYFEIPVADKIDIKTSVGRDFTTSATPFSYVKVNPAGDVKQIVTSATVKDTRNDGVIDLNYYGEKATSKLEVGGSQEFDYLSHFFGGEVVFDLNQKNTALTLGSTYTANTVTPDQMGAPVPRIGGSNYTWQALGGLTQIINNLSLGQFAVTYLLDEGYLRDPYKPNLLPQTREGWSFAGRYLRYLPSFHDGSINLEYRYYTDDWGVNSSTFKAVLRLALRNGWGLEPGIRYYTQNGSIYYNLLVPPNLPRNNTTIFYTQTYQFASYGQVTGLLQVNKQISASHTVYVGGNYGVRNASLRLGGTKVTNPHEPVFTKFDVAELYIGLKSVY